jgi:hypothetical protein
LPVPELPKITMISPGSAARFRSSNTL